MTSSDGGEGQEQTKGGERTVTAWDGGEGWKCSQLQGKQRELSLLLQNESAISPHSASIWYITKGKFTVQRGHFKDGRRPRRINRTDSRKFWISEHMILRLIMRLVRSSHFMVQEIKCFPMMRGWRVCGVMSESAGKSCMRWCVGATYAAVWSRVNQCKFAPLMCFYSIIQYTAI